MLLPATIPPAPNNYKYWMQKQYRGWLQRIMKYKSRNEFVRNPTHTCREQRDHRARTRGYELANERWPLFWCDVLLNTLKQPTVTTYGGPVFHTQAWACRCQNWSDTHNGEPCETDVMQWKNVWTFLARDNIIAYMLSVLLYAIVPLSVCLSVCLSHGWISQKRLKWRLRNFHHTTSIQFCGISFIQKS